MIKLDFRDGPSRRPSIYDSRFDSHCESLSRPLVVNLSSSLSLPPESKGVQKKKSIVSGACCLFRVCALILFTTCKFPEKLTKVEREGRFSMAWVRHCVLGLQTRSLRRCSWGSWVRQSPRSMLLGSRFRTGLCQWCRTRPPLLACIAERSVTRLPSLRRPKRSTSDSSSTSTVRGRSFILTRSTSTRHLR